MHGRLLKDVTQNFTRCLLVLRGTINRERLGKAWYTARHAGLRVLWIQTRLHIAYRLRQRQRAKLSTPTTYQEAPWPSRLPLVSVIIPCFNYGEFVAEAIDSVLAQTFNDLEVILVEGGSTDGVTPGIVRALERPNVITLYRDLPCKVGDNRNFGIEHARGKYICCLDADDMIATTYIEKAVYILETQGYDVVSTIAQRFGGNTGAYEILSAPTLADLTVANHVSTSAVFRRRFWAMAGGYKDVAPDTPHLHEDWRFWLRLGGLGARFFNITQERLFFYRVHARGSLSSNSAVLPMHVQTKLIREAENSYITKQKIQQSELAAWRQLQSSTCASNMCRHTAGNSNDKTILLAVPFLVLGGAERLLSEIVGYLRKTGYRMVIIKTLSSRVDMGDTTSWFQPATDEIYDLSGFLDEDKWSGFIDYLIPAKNVWAIWIVGSTLLYDKLPQLKARYPSIFVVDLLFNTVGHTHSNKRYREYIDMNIVETELVGDYLIGFGEQPNRVRVIHSGIDLEKYRPIPRPAHVLSGLGVSTGSFVVGYSGRLSIEKAPMSVLAVADAIESVDNVHFIITGAGLMEHDLCSCIRRHKRASQIHFVGVVADVRAYLACYDVLLLPSEVDGRPMIVLEALAMGIPVIASAVGGLPDLITHGENGFLCSPGDISAYVKYITILYENPDMHQKMKVAARKFALDFLDIEQMRRSYAEIFDDARLRSANQASFDTT